jgi:acetylornithine deacetylase
VQEFSKAKFDVFFYRPPLEVSKNQLIVRSLAKAYYNTLKQSPEFIGIGGWMDSAILAEAGIPTVIFGPSGEGLHAAMEYVDFDSVIVSTKILVDTIVEFCGIENWFLLD